MTKQNLALGKFDPSMEQYSVEMRLAALRDDLVMPKEQSAGYKAFLKGTLDDKVKPLLNKYGLYVSISGIKEYTMQVVDKISKKGMPLKHYVAKCVAVFKISCVFKPNENYMYIETPAAGCNSEGDPSKSTGNLLSYAYKYMILTNNNVSENEIEVDAPVDQNGTGTPLSSAPPAQQQVVQAEVLPTTHVNYQPPAQQLAPAPQNSQPAQPNVLDHAGANGYAPPPPPGF